jgi:hypothetical protein
MSMHARLTDLPLHNPASNSGYLSVVWGGLQIGYSTVRGPTDCTPLYADLPGGVCNCRHWGYIFEGALTARYPNGEHEDETARAGDVYYFPAGHVLIYEEPTKALEFNPPEELETLMTAIYKKMRELGLIASK